MPITLDALDQLRDFERAVMSLYIHDTGSKFDLLGDIADRITLLLEIVNRKFRHKQIGISRDEGLVALGDDGSRVGLNLLSSGEQHELVLIYDLLFAVLSNSLVMIDEPELSLHVVWQKAFLTDLISIVKTTQFDVLLATHSPFIVGDKTELMVPLALENDLGRNE
jgi:predicted ATP-binding protein involved in virulence